METLGIGLFLLVIMMVLLSGGVWIAMTLAICGWVGQAFFVTTPARQEPVLGLLGKQRLVGTGGAAAVHLDGRDPFRTKLSEEMFEGLRPWLNRIPGRLMHTTILGCGIFGSVSGSSAATCATISKVALPELRSAATTRSWRWARSPPAARSAS